MAKKKAVKRIPKFRGYEEEALFWDTHSPEAFPEEFKEVKVKFRRPLNIRLAVPLDKTVIKELERISKEQGTEPITLARQWIMERIASARH